MALWLVRTGTRGQHEQKFLQTSRVYATWDGLNRNLAELPDFAAVRESLHEVFPNAARGTLVNWSGQLWTFSHDMKVGDWVAVPLRSKAAIAFGEITGPYEYDAMAEDPYLHSHKVAWLNTDVPRSTFDKDLLRTFDAFMTVYELKRRDVEKRVRALAKAGWKQGSSGRDGSDGESEGADDWGQRGRKRTARRMEEECKGSGIAGDQGIHPGARPMIPLTTFDSTKESLSDLLASIRKGKTQLPDFQRGWVWDDEHIRSLLASISLSYPIGAVMLLQTGNPGVKFKPRVVEGVEQCDCAEPERLILDGQQRLTALFQSMFSGNPVKTQDSRRNPIARWYYLDIKKALSNNGDREDAVISIPADRKVLNFRGEVSEDYSTAEKECAADRFPLSLVFDVAALTNWQMSYLQLDPANIHDRLAKWNNLVQNVIQRFQQYQLPLILLRRETPKVAVCQVFEKVNTGGVTLTVFDLLTATFAVDDFSLRDDWRDREKQLRKDKVLSSMTSSDFLQAVALLSTRVRRNHALENGTEPGNAPGISCKREGILSMTLKDYNIFADPVTKAFKEVAKFLHAQRIFTARDLPYRTQLVPLAAVFAVLGERAENDGVRKKLAQWYWCGVFGELYGGAIETRFARDLPEVLAWIDDGPEPITITDASFIPVRLLTLHTRNSAAYKGISALLLRDGGLDFRTGDPVDTQMYFDDKIDIHHIFPDDWCKRNQIEPKRCDCIVNKTPLSARTNRVIGGNAPSIYLPKIQKGAGIDDTRMDHILRSHVIEPALLRTDDFHGFFRGRQETLLSRIEAAMGKPIARGAPVGEMEAKTAEPGDYENEEVEDAE
jgi:hypothetical protein